jgi:hypothetical protein
VRAHASTVLNKRLKGQSGHRTGGIRTTGSRPTHDTTDTRISHAHPTRPPARTAMESTTMDSSVQIVSLVYSMRRGPAAMQGLVLLRVRTCNTRAPVILAWRVLLRVCTCNTRAPVILAWRVLRGARRHTQGKGGAKPHPRERWGTSTEGRDATPKGKVAQSHTQGKGGGPRLKLIEYVTLCAGCSCCIDREPVAASRRCPVERRA